MTLIVSYISIIQTAIDLCILFTLRNADKMYKSMVWELAVISLEDMKKKNYLDCEVFISYNLASFLCGGEGSFLSKLSLWRFLKIHKA